MRLHGCRKSPGRVIENNYCSAPISWAICTCLPGLVAAGGGAWRSALFGSTTCVQLNKRRAGKLPAIIIIAAHLKVRGTMRHSRQERAHHQSASSKSNYYLLPAAHSERECVCAHLLVRGWGHKYPAVIYLRGGGVTPWTARGQCDLFKFPHSSSSARHAAILAGAHAKKWHSLSLPPTPSAATGRAASATSYEGATFYQTWDCGVEVFKRRKIAPVT